MKKLFALLLALAMVLSLAGCTKPGTGKDSTKAADGSGSAEAAELDTSKEVEIVMYFISNRPTKQDEIDANMNKIFKEKLNCTLKVNWISWSDYANTYNL